MAKTICDDELRRWEAFASTGPYGFAAPARVVFQCASDPWERPRSVLLEGDKSDAEAIVASGSAEKLRELLAQARPLS